MKNDLEWAISVLDSLGHDLETGAESKASIAKRAHARANELRARVNDASRLTTHELLQMAGRLIVAHDMPALGNRVINFTKHVPDVPISPALIKEEAS